MAAQLDLSVRRNGHRQVVIERKEQVMDSVPHNAPSDPPPPPTIWCWNCADHTGAMPGISSVCDRCEEETK